jgi:hypothetical protein
MKVTISLDFDALKDDIRNEIANRLDDLDYDEEVDFLYLHRAPVCNSPICAVASEEVLRLDAPKDAKRTYILSLFGSNRSRLFRVWKSDSPTHCFSYSLKHLSRHAVIIIRSLSVFFARQAVQIKPVKRHAINHITFNPAFALHIFRKLAGKPCFKVVFLDRSWRSCAERNNNTCAFIETFRTRRNHNNGARLDHLRLTHTREIAAKNHACVGRMFDWHKPRTLNDTILFASGVCA